jgi:hypothetical protein
MNVTIFSANPSEFNDETCQLREIALVLKSAPPADKPIYMITNVLLENMKIDCILLTEKGPIIIDCYEYQGTLSGCEHGSWTVRISEEQTLEMIKNPFKEAHDKHFAFLRKWRPVRDKYFDRQIPEKQVLHFCNWVYFKPGSQHNDAQMNYHKAKWFSVITKENLVQMVENQHHQYRISKTGYDKILHEFGINTTPIITYENSSNVELFQIISAEGNQQDVKDLRKKDEVKNTSGPIPIIMQKGLIQILIPLRIKRRTPEFLSALKEAQNFFEIKNFEKALKFVEFALKKDYNDLEAQDLKYEILCSLGKDDEAENYLLKAVKG